MVYKKNKKKLKILNISYSDLFGGAAKSAFRINKSLNNLNEITSNMLVIKKISNNKNVIKFGNKIDDLLFKFKNYIGIIIGKLDKNKNPTSYNLFNSPILKYINQSKFDLINFHWINSEMISLKDLLKINKPYVLTLHDMWWISGTENYLYCSKNSIKNGLFENSLSNKLWKIKSNLKPVGVITPSIWLSNYAKLSPVTNKCKIETIPYPVDTKIFKPIKLNSISKLALYRNNKIKILFVVFGNPKESRKGLDLLISSLKLINNDNIELVIVGRNFYYQNLKFNVFFINYIESENQMNKLYNLCDLVIIPSRLDNLPNVALESLAVGKPLVAFNVGGMPDLIKHNYNGYLVKPYNVKELGNFIKILVNNKKKRNLFSKNSLSRFKKNFSEKKIMAKYKFFLKSINY